MNFPEEFFNRMKERLGAEFPAFFQSYKQPPCKGLRVNPLKIRKEEFARRAPFPLGREIDWEKNGYYLEREKAGADPYHFAGLFYLQEPSAMCAAPLLAPVLQKEGARVLDLCAAPGGKTTQLAGEMAGRGILVANEVVYSRAKILSENVERAGIKNCAVISAEPSELAARFENYFDGVLVDAPCSGEGMFKKEPNAVAEWSRENVARCALRQREILDDAAKTVAGGGLLVYSTCTFSEEEDEWQIEDFLRRHPEFTLKEMHKLYPHTVEGEGHFAALLEREAGERKSAKPYPLRRDGKAEYAFSEFFKDFSAVQPEGDITTLIDGRIFLVPRGMPAAVGRALRVGVELGEWDGRVFKPAHALAMSLTREECKRFVSLTREECESYLRGETLALQAEKGWCVVGVEEYPLGLGKSVDGVIKNHLPKALRRFAK